MVVRKMRCVIVLERRQLRQGYGAQQKDNEHRPPAGAAAFCIQRTTVGIQTVGYRAPSSGWVSTSEDSFSLQPDAVRTQVSRSVDATEADFESWVRVAMLLT